MPETTSLASSSWTRSTPSVGGGSARAPALTERSRQDFVYEKLWPRKNIEVCWISTFSITEDTYGAS